MPKFPTPVNLADDNRLNKDRALTLSVVSELRKMDEVTRAKTFAYSLTASQQKEYVVSGTRVEDLGRSFENSLKSIQQIFPKMSMRPAPDDTELIYETLPHLRPRKINRPKPHIASYDRAAQILTVDGVDIVLSASERRAVLCEILFDNKKEFVSLVKYEYIWRNHKDLLSSYGYTDKNQIRSAETGINIKVNKITGKDFFIGRGGIQRNPKFRLNR